MASPTLNGYGASRSGAVLASQSSAAPTALAPMTLGMTNPLLWGLVVALALMAYWYRRIL